MDDGRDGRWKAEGGSSVLGKDVCQPDGRSSLA